MRPISAAASGASGAAVGKGASLGDGGPVSRESRRAAERRCGASPSASAPSGGASAAPGGWLCCQDSLRSSALISCWRRSDTACRSERRRRFAAWMRTALFMEKGAIFCGIDGVTGRAETLTTLPPIELDSEPVPRQEDGPGPSSDVRGVRSRALRGGVKSSTGTGSARWSRARSAGGCCPGGHRSAPSAAASSSAAARAGSGPSAATASAWPAAPRADGRDGGPPSLRAERGASAPLMDESATLGIGTPCCRPPRREVPRALRFGVSASPAESSTTLLSQVSPLRAGRPPRAPLFGAAAASDAAVVTVSSSARAAASRSMCLTRSLSMSSSKASVISSSVSASDPSIESSLPSSRKTAETSSSPSASCSPEAAALAIAGSSPDARPRLSTLTILSYDHWSTPSGCDFCIAWILRTAWLIFCQAAASSPFALATLRRRFVLVVVVVDTVSDVMRQCCCSASRGVTRLAFSNALRACRSSRMRCSWFSSPSL